VLLCYRDENFMANFVNLLRNYRKVFPLQNFDNETTYRSYKNILWKLHLSRRLCDLNLELQGRTNNVKKKKTETLKILLPYIITMFYLFFFFSI
jgi:hypothetical protein